MTDLDSPSNAGIPAWAVVEIMGHQRHVGWLQEVSLAGQRMLAVDEPLPEGLRRVLVGPSSVYRISFVSGEDAHAHHRPPSVRNLGYSELPSRSNWEEVDDDELDDSGEIDPPDEDD